MEDVSQVWNKLIGRNQDWAEDRPWENAERSGWLMKQGAERNLTVQPITLKILEENKKVFTPLLNR